MGMMEGGRCPGGTYRLALEAVYVLFLDDCQRSQVDEFLIDHGEFPLSVTMGSGGEEVTVRVG